MQHLSDEEAEAAGAVGGTRFAVSLVLLAPHATDVTPDTPPTSVEEFERENGAIVKLSGVDSHRRRATLSGLSDIARQVPGVSSCWWCRGELVHLSGCVVRHVNTLRVAVTEIPGWL